MADAGTVDAFTLPVAVLRAAPWRHSAMRSPPLLAGADAVHTSSVIVAHVGANTLVMVDAAIFTREALGAAASLGTRVTMSVVATIIGAHFYLAPLATVAWVTVALSLQACSTTVAAVWAFTNSAIRPRVTGHAAAGTIVAKSVNALRLAETSRTVRSEPSSHTLADAIDTFASLAAVSRAVLVRTFLAKEAGKAVAGAVVTVAVARAVAGACQQRAVVALESRMTFTQIVHTRSMSIATVWTGASRARSTREALVTEAGAVVA